MGLVPFDVCHYRPRKGPANVHRNNSVFCTLSLCHNLAASHTYHPHTRTYHPAITARNKMTLVPATVIIPILAAFCAGSGVCLYLSSHAFGTRPQTMSPKWKLMVRQLGDKRARLCIPSDPHRAALHTRSCTPHTHAQEEQQIYAKPREAGGPVALNPFYRNLPADFKLYESNTE